MLNGEVKNMKNLFYRQLQHLAKKKHTMFIFEYKFHNLKKEEADIV
jgi:hypothetical protein